MPNRNRSRILPLVLLVYVFGALALMTLAPDTSASVFTNLQENLAAKLDITSGAAGMILGCAVMLGIGLPLAFLEMDPLGIAIIMICVLAAMIVIGWLQAWLLLIVGVIAAVMLASKFFKPFGGG